MLQLAGPVEAALRASEAPKTVRVAFEVELRSDSAMQSFAFDPRQPPDKRWRLIDAKGEDAYLDEISAAWGAEVAPDGRLFPDDLRESLGQAVEIEDLGSAWKLSFDHTPSANDGAFDIWAAGNLKAVAWLSPDRGRFLRIDYELPAPVDGPEGGRLLAYEQSYILQDDPVYQLSLITSFRLCLMARGFLRTEERSYDMQVRKAEVFFATPEDEARFIAAKGQVQADLTLSPR